MTIRYIKQNSREDTCKNCPELDVNYNSDESYCNLADGEEVRLKRGQHRPEWCPKRVKGLKGNDKGETNAVSDQLSESI